MPGSLSPSASEPWPIRALPAFLMALVAVPCLTAGAALAAKGWHPVGELAMAELRLRGFWDHPPDLGAVARIRVGDDNAAHPGPLAYWLLYPVFAVFGRSPAALAVSVGVIGAAWSAATVWLVWRRAGVGAAALITGALLAVLGGLGPAVLSQPWNPYLGVLPFTFLVVAAWDVSGGAVRTLPAMVVSASVCMQTHFGYVPVTAALVLFAVIGLLWSLRASGTAVLPWRHSLVWVAGSAALGVLLWVPVLAQQLAGDPGNLALLWEGWRSRDLPPVGLSEAFAVVAHHLDVFDTWVRGGSVITEEGFSWGTFVLAVTVLVTAVVAFRKRREDAWSRILRLQATLAVATVAALFGISRTTGLVYDYLVVWLLALCALWVFCVAWAAWAGVLERSSPEAGRGTGGSLRLAPAAAPAEDGRAGNGHARVRYVVPVAVFALVTLCVVTTVRVADPPIPERDRAAAVEALAPGVEDVLDPQDRYLLRWTDPAYYGAIGFGLLARLERDGYRVSVPDTYRVEAMPWRTVSVSAAGAGPGGDDATGAGPLRGFGGVLWVVTGDSVAEWRERADAIEVASFDPRSGSERRAQTDTRPGLVDRLEEIGGADLASKLATDHWAILFDPRVDERTKDQLVELAREGLETAVFLLPSDSAPL